MSEIKLKPCPFCGSEDIYQFCTKNPEIFCNTCKAIFAVKDDSQYLNCDEGFKYRIDKTAEAWNKRAEQPSAQPEIIRCEDCMHNGSYDTDCPIDWNGKEYCSFAERRTNE